MKWVEHEDRVPVFVGSIGSKILYRLTFRDGAIEEIKAKTSNYRGLFFGPYRCYSIYNNDTKSYDIYCPFVRDRLIGSIKIDEEWIEDAEYTYLLKQLNQ